MNRRVGLAALAFILFLSSCTVGPNYTKPKLPAAPAYSEPAPASFDQTPGWKTANPSDALMKGKWWEIYHNADLNALEEQVGPANQTLQVAAANYRQARTQIQFNRSNLYPTIGTGPSITGNRTSANVPNANKGTEYGLFTLPVSLSWEADLWGKIRRSVTSAKELTQASAADLANVKLELEAELATDYFETRSLDAQKRLLDDTVVAYTRALQLTQNRYNGGVASKVEVEQAATQLQQTQAADIDLAVARAQYEHAIAVLVGRVPENFHLPLEPADANTSAGPDGRPFRVAGEETRYCFRGTKISRRKRTNRHRPGRVFPRLDDQRSWRISGGQHRELVPVAEPFLGGGSAACQKLCTMQDGGAPCSKARWPATMPIWPLTGRHL